MPENKQATSIVNKMLKKLAIERENNKKTLVFFITEMNFLA